MGKCCTFIKQRTTFRSGYQSSKHAHETMSASQFRIPYQQVSVPVPVPDLSADSRIRPDYIAFICSFQMKMLKFAYPRNMTSYALN
jgi:hypothetical protein